MWFFGGEFVVDCVANVVSERTLFLGWKTGQAGRLIFAVRRKLQAVLRLGLLRTIAGGFGRGYASTNVERRVPLLMQP
jgi:hypothetical protein